MPNILDLIHGKGKPDSFRDSWRCEKVIDHVELYIDGLRLRDPRSISEREYLATNFLFKEGDCFEHSCIMNQGFHSFLGSRYLWLQSDGLCPDAINFDFVQCCKLLNHIYRRLAGLAKAARCVRQHQMATFHDGNKYSAKIKQELQRFWMTYGDQTYATTTSSANIILFLESVLDTCLSLPALRPFFLPLAESKMIPIVSKMLDYLLGLESLESNSLEDHLVEASAKPDSKSLTATDATAVCAKFLLNAVKWIAGYLIDNLDQWTSCIRHRRVVSEQTKYFTRFFRMMIGSGPVDSKFLDLANSVHEKMPQDSAGIVSWCVWLHDARHAKDAEPCWGNLQDDKELMKFLQPSPLCDCTGTPEQPTCHKCLSRLYSFLDSFLDSAEFYHRMLRDTKNVVRNVLKMVRYTSGKSKRRHRKAADEIKVKIKRRLVLFLFPHLHRIARLTDNFSRFIKSLNMARFLMKTLCKFAYRYTNAPGELAFTFIDEDWDVPSASLELRNDVLQIEDKIVLLKRLDRCIREERNIAAQLLEKEERQAEAEFSQENCPSATIAADPIDMSLSGIDLTWDPTQDIASSRVRRRAAKIS